MIESNEDLQIKLARKFIKMKIIEDNLTFRDHEEQKLHISDLISRTVEAGESNSALVIGPRGSGKTTLLNSIIWELNNTSEFQTNSITINLNGLLHTDDKLALKSITSQMSLENAVGDKVFSSFSENLAFLLSSLKSGQNKHCKSIIFILEEFDLFCHHGSQTLLYNLFDVAQSKQAPICVLGLTCRLDVIELLEKRVKSRYSHRQIFIFPNNVSNDTENCSDILFAKRVCLFVKLLSLPCEIKKPKKSKNISHRNSYSDSEDQDNCDKNFEIPYDILLKCKSNAKEFQELDPIFVSFWNENIKALSEDKKVLSCLQKFYDVNVNEQSFKNFMMELACKLSFDHPQLEVSDVLNVTQNYINVDEKILVLTSLSILELSLIIAMKHQMDIFDGQPMNFEMILNRYTKFANSNSSAQSVPRPVILKAFEHLKSLEIICPIKGDTSLNVDHIQKEYQLHRLLVTPSQISEAVKQYKSLPTELIQWACSSLI
ncbi:origin recognition complex subunit 4 [Arctopsyche grandis]|uniref:origin recognition complex subunit 4 n=1 Tax=Arctopsyche grandis TaxID=121162 RepID=UPI00406D638C